MDNLTAKIYQSRKTVLTTKDLALLWEETNQNNLKAKIAYYVKQGSLIRLTRGIFAKDKKYNLKELATSIYTPAYLSFETVLREAGIIFQHSDSIFGAASLSRTIIIDQHRIVLRKLKDEVLFNAAGILFKDEYSIATPERAFLDMIYLSPRYYFDNLDGLDWEKCSELVSIYKNQQMVGRLQKYRKNYNDRDAQ
jgi:hypothetical protein